MGIQTLTNEKNILQQEYIQLQNLYNTQYNTNQELKHNISITNQNFLNITKEIILLNNTLLQKIENLEMDIKQLMDIYDEKCIDCDDLAYVIEELRYNNDVVEDSNTNKMNEKEIT